ncbi:hypothetical protein [Borreliella turdi]|uniref:hypothetical protein n=1 Tax=Borreliella turdi TaxID=57863 RepID=UPI001244615E|nr:hypothetical protein [Borreliella turdi]
MNKRLDNYDFENKKDRTLFYPCSIDYKVFKIKIRRLKKVFLDALDVMGRPIENKLITLIIFIKPEIITFL